MPFDANGYWHPNLSPKQLEIFNSYARFLLAAGPKRTGKSLGNVHRIIRHAVEVNGARIGVFAKTQKNATAGGIWQDILDICLPEWIKAGQTKFTTTKVDGTPGVRQMAQTRMLYFKIQTATGGESEFQLHSIHDENEVEAIAKGTRFSCFYFPELSNFKKRLVFDITADQLRMPEVSFEDHLWISDTNPSDEGEDSWIHDIWYKIPQKDESALEPYERVQKKYLRLIEVMIPDNPFLTPEELEVLYAQFSHDPDLFARYIEGKWVRATRNAIFINQFKENIHKVGEARPTASEEDWDVLLPSNSCTGLVSGWDLGDVGMSSHIVEQVEGAKGNEYWVLDEVVHINRRENIGLSDFAGRFMERYEVWMKVVCGDDQAKREKFWWRHWSDAAALTHWRSGAEAYDKNLIAKYTDDLVVLMAAPKFPDSIRKRIIMLRILLFEQRIFVSARCHHTITMFKALKSGKGNRLIDHTDPLRHIFDSLSYAIGSEEPALLLEEMTESRGQNLGGIITSPL